MRGYQDAKAPGSIVWKWRDSWIVEEEVDLMLLSAIYALSFLKIESRIQNLQVKESENAFFFFF